MLRTGYAAAALEIAADSAEGKRTQTSTLRSERSAYYQALSEWWPVIAWAEGLSSSTTHASKVQCPDGLYWALQLETTEMQCLVHKEGIFLAVAPSPVGERTFLAVSGHNTEVALVGLAHTGATLREVARQDAGPTLSATAIMPAAPRAHAAQSTTITGRQPPPTHQTAPAPVVRCAYCRRAGHAEKECRTKARDGEHRQQKPKAP